MNKYLSNKKFFYIIVGVLFILVFGVTYAFFTTSLNTEGNINQIVTETGRIELNYIDGDFIVEENIFPGWSTNKTIVVTNIGSLDAYYKIYWKELTNNFEQEELVLKAVCTSYENYGEESQVISGACDDIEETPISNVAGSIKENIGVEVGFTHVYSFTFTFKEMSSLQNYNQGKTFGGVLNIDDSYGLYTMNGTLLDAEGDPLISTLVSLSNGKSATTNSEGRFTIEEVDEGNYNLTIGEVTDSLTLETGRELGSSGNTIISNIENKEINVTIQLGEGSITYNVTNQNEYDLNVLALYIDGVKSTSLNNSKHYSLISYSCTNGETVNWNNSTNEISIVPFSSTTKCTVNFNESNTQVTLNSNGGTISTSTYYVQRNSAYGNIPIPTKANTIFAGWYSTSNYDINSYVDNTTIVSNVENHTLYAKWVDVITNYTYSGTYNEYRVPVTGTYKIELWGAEGGDSVAYPTGGGSYTSGLISMNKDEVLYFYVGKKGNVGRVGNDSTFSRGPGGVLAFNGGGSGGQAGGGEYPYSRYLGGFSGGGATDVRFFEDSMPISTTLEWSSLIGLRSRIMVAGASGGGGSTSSDTENHTMIGSILSGEGGGLMGYTGQTIDSYHINNQTYYYSTNAGSGGTQKSSLFGIGGKGNDSAGSQTATLCHGHSGGGGGYYAGTGGLHTNYNCFIIGGGGGSSFISGHQGCIAVSSINSTASRTGTGGATCAYSGSTPSDYIGTTDSKCSEHFTGKKFTETYMIDGKGYSWTNKRASIPGTILMPNPLGGTYEAGVGHSGNGYARITYIPD